MPQAPCHSSPVLVQSSIYPRSGHSSDHPLHSKPLPSFSRDPSTFTLQQNTFDVGSSVDHGVVFNRAVWLFIFLFSLISFSFSPSFSFFYFSFLPRSPASQQRRRQRRQNDSTNQVGSLRRLAPRSRKELGPSDHERHRHASVLDRYHHNQDRIVIPLHHLSRLPGRQALRGSLESKGSPQLARRPPLHLRRVGYL